MDWEGTQQESGEGEDNRKRAAAQQHGLHKQEADKPLQPVASHHCHQLDLHLQRVD